LTETLDLAKWGTQLNAFMMFILGPVINLAK
jgi:hypothetical protein